MGFRSFLRAAAIAGLVSGAILLVAVLFGSETGLISAALYLFAILLPGGVVYTALVSRFRSGESGVIATVFFSNLLGTALLEGSGWLLARSWVFSLSSVFAVEAVVVASTVLGCRRALGDLLKSGPSSCFKFDRAEASYLAVAAAFAVVVLLPTLVLQSQGYLLGGDTATFTAIGAWDAHAGAWLPLSQVWYPYAPLGGLSPGLPMFYGVFAAATGAPPIEVAGPLMMAALLPAILGIYLLAKRFTERRVLWYSLPPILVLSSAGANQLLSNNVLTTVFMGTFPDALFSLVGFVAALVLLTDLLRGKGPQWREIALLSAAFVVVSLDDQLTFLFLAAAVVLFGIEILWYRGVRWSLSRLFVSILPTVALLPPFLLPGNQTSSSPGFEGETGNIWTALVQVRPGFVETTWGILGTLAALVVVGVVGWVLYRRLKTWRRGGSPLAPSGTIPLVALGALALYLAVTPVGYDLTGNGSVRFLGYVGLAWVGVVAYGLDALSRIRARELARRLAVVAVVLLLLGAGLVGATTAYNATSGPAQRNSLASPDIRAAGVWLGSHAATGTLVIGDENGGNVGFLTLGDYLGAHVFYTRARSGLYQEIFQTSAPTNNSAYYSNLVLMAPTPANSAATYQVMNAVYYAFQTGYSNAQIQAFSLLPYFAQVYSNPDVVIFEYLGSGQLGFVPALSYCSISSTLAARYEPDAYSAAADYPTFANSVTSTASGVDGANVTFCLSVPSAGNYTVWVHRITQSTADYLSVAIGGTVVGQVHFSTVGPGLGTPLSITLPAGIVSLSLVVEGTAGPVDPIDYLVVAPS